MDFVEERKLGGFHDSQYAAARAGNHLHKVDGPATQHRHYMNQSIFNQNHKKAYADAAIHAITYC